MWISSAKYYWPLSATEKDMILGTTIGKVYGKVNPTRGVKEKENTALLFSGEGSYIDLGKFDKECFGNPDYCSFGLSLSFMAYFDLSAASWTKRVNILDSLGNEDTSNKGISVYIQNKNLWFVISKTSRYKKVSVPLVDNEWRHYVIRWDDSLGLRVSVNGKDIPRYVFEIYSYVISQYYRIQHQNISLYINRKFFSNMVKLTLHVSSHRRFFVEAPHKR